MTDSRHGRGVTETPIGAIGNLDLSMVVGAAAIVRRPSSIIDERRLAWARDTVNDQAAGPLLDVVRAAGQTWIGSLPQDFPADAAVQTVEALTALVRCGYIVARGMPTFGVTATIGRLSTMGREFVRHEEGLAPTVYWPGGKSGVTIGPGYDMYSKSADTIIADLVGVGMSYEDAEAVSDASGVRGEKAARWVANFKRNIDLTSLQQTMLLDKLVPTYEATTLCALPVDIRDRLFPHEFDALFSLAWNLTSYGHYDFNGCLNRYDFDAAAAAIPTLVGGGPGIPPRRRREVKMFTTGFYELKPMVEHPDYDDPMPTRAGAYSHA